MCNRSSEAMKLLKAARRVFPRCWFNETTTEAGRDALGYYHERQDEKRSIGLGPEHDWSSHAADAFGYMAIAYEEPPANSRRIRATAAPTHRHSLVGLSRSRLRLPTVTFTAVDAASRSR